jgi:hypothetical protein
MGKMVAPDMAVRRSGVNRRCESKGVGRFSPTGFSWTRLGSHHLSHPGARRKDFPPNARISLLARNTQSSMPSHTDDGFL